MKLLKVLGQATSLSGDIRWDFYGITHEDPETGETWIEVELEDYRSAR